MARVHTDLRQPINLRPTLQIQRRLGHARMQLAYERDELSGLGFDDEPDMISEAIHAITATINGIQYELDQQGAR